LSLKNAYAEASMVNCWFSTCVPPTVAVKVSEVNPVPKDVLPTRPAIRSPSVPAPFSVEG
jgi:hypothetical protein